MAEPDLLVKIDLLKGRLQALAAENATLRH